MSMKEEPRGESKDQVVYSIRRWPSLRQFSFFLCLEDESMALLKEEPKEMTSEDGEF